MRAAAKEATTKSAQIMAHSTLHLLHLELDFIGYFLARNQQQITNQRYTFILEIAMSHPVRLMGATGFFFSLPVFIFCLAVVPFRSCIINVQPTISMKRDSHIWRTLMLASEHIDHFVIACKIFHSEYFNFHLYLNWHFGQLISCDMPNEAGFVIVSSEWMRREQIEENH